MDQVKRTYRTVKTDVKKTARGVDGTDFKDQVGNAGDEVGKDLGQPGRRCRQGGSGAGGLQWRPGPHPRADDVKPRRGERRV